MDLKKITLALCALGLSSVASAGGFMPAPSCSNQPVSVPCEHTGWDFGLTAYWGRITSDYMEVDSINNGTGSEALLVRPGYRFGFGAEASYHWGHGHDFVVDWTHFNKTFDENSFADDGGEFANSGDTLLNRAQFKFDTVNFALGQSIDVGSEYDVRMHGGIQYLKVDRRLDYIFADEAAINDGDFNQRIIDSRFSGVGPRVGFDTAYHIANNWSLIGNAAVSVIHGKVRGVAFNNDIENGILNDSRRDVFDRTHTIVAGLDGKAGVRFNHPISSGVLSVTGGYAGAVYMNTVVNTQLEDLDDSWLTGHFGVGSFFLSAKYTS